MQITRFIPTSGRRALVASLATVATLGAGALQASSAEALVHIRQTSGEQLKIFDSNPNDLTIGGNETINISLQDANTWRFDIQGQQLEIDRVFDVRLINTPLCQEVNPDANGFTNTVLCPRATFPTGIEIRHGKGNDKTIATPDFPDSIETIGGPDDDLLQTGAGNDNLRGGTGKNSLNGQLGRDRYSNDGGSQGSVINARDGIGEKPIECDNFSRVPQTLVIIDLKDDDFLPGCINIDRSDKREGPNVKFRTSKDNVSDGAADVKLECPKSLKSSCKGTLRIADGEKSAGKASYSVKPGKSTTVEVELSDSLLDKVERKSRTVTATATESGEHGKKTAQRAVKLSS